MILYHSFSSLTLLPSDPVTGEKYPSALEFVAQLMGLETQEEIQPYEEALVMGIGETMNEVRRVCLRTMRESFQGKRWKYWSETILRLTNDAFPQLLYLVQQRRWRPSRRHLRLWSIPTIRPST